MSILLNCILAFYPAALVWSFLPTLWLHKLDSFGSGGLTHFIIRLIAYGIIYFISYKVINNVAGRYSSRSGALSFIMAIISFILLVVITFYQILPGPDVYTAPHWASAYVLKTPFSFFAVLIPLIYLFFE